MTARTGPVPLARRFEAVVAGGGPAGAVAALVLARAGRRVLLVDGGPPGAPSAAFTVGETLPPAARPLLHDLGLWAAFAADAHLSCPGTYASWGSAQLHGHSHLLDPHGHGWHLDRNRFDAFLREAAVAAGALIRRAVVVGHRSEAKEQHLLVRERGGAVQELCSGWVVDATGRRALIGRRRALRRRQDRLVAAFTLLGARGAGGHAGDLELRTLVEAVPEGWWYTARVPAGRVVAHLTDADLAAARLRTAGGFRYAAARTRHVRDRLSGYDPADSPAPHWTAAHGQRLSPPAGPGWVAAGDAAIAFDPLSSQGILTALHTGARAGRAVDRCLAGDTGALASYAAFLDRVADAYHHHHAQSYAEERRWPEHPFWRRRNGWPH
ncbi:tryptophan 7-halogenase [Streptomyces sp. ISL-98]|uniref:tryptophan 7-halogenase n=1 Tax=Streptomyces sp. ISL-98 TaxID=2819192 RepID=UPI001BEBA0C4|nr:tryptophan 7-halogenase [Streptomyces sp. ISL-98]MBT2509460.1 tryptophan 7-halogenase [Streptomyces sp. ISL-98]